MLFSGFIKHYFIICSYWGAQSVSQRRDGPWFIPNPAFFCIQCTQFPRYYAVPFFGRKGPYGAGGRRKPQVSRRLRQVGRFSATGKKATLLLKRGLPPCSGEAGPCGRADIGYFPARVSGKCGSKEAATSGQRAIAACPGNIAIFISSYWQVAPKKVSAAAVLLPIPFARRSMVPINCYTRGEKHDEEGPGSRRQPFGGTSA